MTSRAAPASAREATKEDEVLQWRSLHLSDAASDWQGSPAGLYSLAHAEFDGAGTVIGLQCQLQTPRPEASIRRPALGGRRPRRAALASAHDHAPLTCILSALLLAAGECFRAPGISFGVCVCKQKSCVTTAGTPKTLRAPDLWVWHAGHLPAARAQGEVLYNLAYPSSGHGIGGYMVTVVGAGFNTLSSDYRCKFACGASSLLSAASTP